MPTLGDCFWYKHPASPVKHLCIVIHRISDHIAIGHHAYVVANVSHVPTDNACVLTIDDHAALDKLGSYVRYDKLDILDNKTLDMQLRNSSAIPLKVTMQVVQRIQAAAHLSKQTPLKYRRILPNPIPALIPTQRPAGGASAAGEPFERGQERRKKGS